MEMRPVAFRRHIPSGTFRRSIKRRYMFVQHEGRREGGAFDFAMVFRSNTLRGLAGFTILSKWFSKFASFVWQKCVWTDKYIFEILEVMRPSFCVQKANEVNDVDPSLSA